MRAAASIRALPRASGPASAQPRCALAAAATALAGRLLGVDPYGQPGVEAAKIATGRLLAEGDGETSAQIAELLGEGRGTRC